MVYMTLSKLNICIYVDDFSTALLNDSSFFVIAVCKRAHVKFDFGVLERGMEYLKTFYIQLPFGFGDT